MKIKINVSTEKEVEIQVPSFYQVSCHSYKIFSEKRVLAICDLKGYESIEEQDISIIYNSGGIPKEITADRFNEKRDLVLNNLKSL